MYARLAPMLVRQGGVITRGQALDAGLTPSRLTQLLNEGALVWIRRGVYADGELWASLDEFRGRPRVRTRAAVLALHRGWVLSHDSSALEVEMPLIDPTRSLVHITRPGYGSAWTRAGVAHHYARFDPSQLHTTEDGFRRLSIARTAVDLGRAHGELAGLVACDWAMRHGVPRTELMEACLPMSFWPGVIDARAAVARADPRAESVAETLGRDLVQALGIGEVDVQFPLLPDGRLVWCDLRVGNHVFEVQGKIKYVPVTEGGVASKPVSEVVWDEKLRARGIRAENLGLSEIIYEDFFGEKRARAMRRLRTEYAATERRLGVELDPRLAAQAAMLRDRFGWRNRAG